MFKKGNEFKQLRILLPFCIVCAFISISVLSYQGYVRYYISSTQEEYKNSLMQAQRFTDNLFDTIKNEVYNYAADVNVIKLMNSSNISNLNLYLTLYKVDKYVDYNFSSKKLCIYNRSMNRIFYEMKSYTLDEFFDKDLVERLKSGERDAYIYPIPRIAGDYSTQSSTNTDEMYTFLYSSSQGDTLKNAIVVNVPADYITDSVMNVYSEMKAEMIIIDPEGKVVLGSKEYPFLSYIDSGLNNRIQENKEKSGYFVINENKEKSLITYASSKITGWTFLRITSYDMIEQEVLNVMLRTVFLVLGVLILILVVAVLISRNTYKLHLTKIQALERKYERNYGYLETQKLLHSLLLSSRDKAIWERLRQMQNPLAIPGRNFRLILFSIDEYGGYCKENSIGDRELFAFGILNIMGELFEHKDFHIEACSMDDHFVLLLGGCQIETIELDFLKTKGSEVQTAVKQFAQVSLSVIIGEVLASGDEISEEYKACMNFLSYRIYYGSRMLQTTKDIQAQQYKDYDIPEDMLKALVEYMGENDKEQVQAMIRELIRRVKNYAYFSLKLFIMKLATVVQESNWNEHLGYDIVQVENWLALVQRLPELTSLEELEQVITNLAADLMERKVNNDNVQNKRFFKILTKINRIIEESYSDLNFGGEQLAEKLDISPSYLKKIFKANMDISLNEYIASRRLEKVTQLLRDTDIPIVTIAEQCGFYNVNYFYTMFKKKYGVTANTYRQINNNDQ